MRISAKARYGMAAVVKMAQICGTDKSVTIIELSESLNISKIYLEQVFALLKRGGIVTSVKGARGGYFLSRPAKEITAFDVLTSIETSVFEKTENTVSEDNKDIETAMQDTVFSILDNRLRDTLIGITIEDIVNKANENNQNYMYYL